MKEYKARREEEQRKSKETSEKISPEELINFHSSESFYDLNPTEKEKERKKLRKPWLKVPYTISATPDNSAPTTEWEYNLAEFLREWEWTEFVDTRTGLDIEHSIRRTWRFNRERIKREKAYEKKLKQMGKVEKVEKSEPLQVGA